MCKILTLATKAYNTTKEWIIVFKTCMRFPDFLSYGVICKVHKHLLQIHHFQCLYCYIWFQIINNPQPKLNSHWCRLAVFLIQISFIYPTMVRYLNSMHILWKYGVICAIFSRQANLPQNETIINVAWFNILTYYIYTHNTSFSVKHHYSLVP